MGENPPGCSTPARPQGGRSEDQGMVLPCTAARGVGVEGAARKFTCHQRPLSYRCEDNTSKKMLAHCSKMGSFLAHYSWICHRFDTGHDARRSKTTQLLGLLCRQVSADRAAELLKSARIVARMHHANWNTGNQSAQDREFLFPQTDINQGGGVRIGYQSQQPLSIRDVLHLGRR